jgi:hypothetical protein
LVFGWGFHLDGYLRSEVLSMSLDMFGFIDDVFVSIPANQITLTGGGYDTDGIWQDGTETSSPYTVTIQPISDREIQSLQIGGERVVDYRKIYVNDGDFHALSPDAYWEFDANNRGVERYKVVKDDIRVWRNYAKLIVCLQDK